MFSVSSSKIDNSYPFQTQANIPDKYSPFKLSPKKNYHGCLENGDITQFYFKKLKEQKGIEEQLDKDYENLVAKEEEISYKLD